MIPHADLIGRPYAPAALGPDGPLCCTGVALAVLARAGVPVPGYGPASLSPCAPAGASAPPTGDRAGAAPDALGAFLGGQGGTPAWGPGSAPAASDPELALAAWASAPDGPWRSLERGAGGWPPLADADVLLLLTDGHPVGLAVVVDALRGQALAALPGRGAAVLRVRTLAPRIVGVYRWAAA